MSVERFLDTSVFLYQLDGRDAREDFQHLQRIDDCP